MGSFMRVRYRGLQISFDIGLEDQIFFEMGFVTDNDFQQVRRNNYGFDKGLVNGNYLKVVFVESYFEMGSVSMNFLMIGKQVYMICKVLKETMYMYFLRVHI